MFLITAILIWPCFRVEFSTEWGSIESTFIADARLLNDSAAAGQWYPVWYAGTRTAYLYPPALRYGTARLASVLHTSSAHAYHLFIGILYCIGTVAVYLLMRAGGRPRSWAWLGCTAILLVSPAFLFVRNFRVDSGFFAPQRLHVLAHYGEGPHISALCILPLALASMFLASREHRTFWLALTAVAAAVVVSINFYGATALGILFPLLVWSCYLVERRFVVFIRAVAIAVIAYCLTAFWFVPSYMRVTRDNLHLVSESPKPWSIALLAVLIAGYLFLTWRRQWHDAYRLWVFSAAFFLALYVLGYEFIGFQVTGDPRRLVPELDLLMILAGVELVRKLRLKAPALATALIIFAFLPSYKYLRHAWEVFDDDPNWRYSLEYRTADWVAAHYPNDRVLATGSVRFWFNAWQNTRQIDGGSKQGILNPLVSSALYCFSHCTEPLWISDWLRAFGVDLAIVAGKTSRNLYHDIETPEIWTRSFPVLRDDGEGNAYFRFDRRRRGVARIVGGDVLRLKPVHKDDFEWTLHPYVQAIEGIPPGGSDDTRLTIVRNSSDEFQSIRAATVSGEAVLVQESFDPAWHAYERMSSGERLIPIQRDAVGFMILPLGPGIHDIRLVFEMPLEVRIGRMLALIAAAFVLYSILREMFASKEWNKPVLADSSADRA
jgi:hypothetical protein